MKKTKIVATLSDRRCSREFISELHESGMNVVRLNSAHQSLEGALKVARAVRAVSPGIGLMMDTKGPEIRTVPSAVPVPVVSGQIISLCGNPGASPAPDRVGVTHPDFSRDVPPGSRVLIDDGAVELVAESARGDALLCRVINDGVIPGSKSVNTPDVRIDLPPVSPRDLEYLEFSIENGFDFVAHSFVRDSEDVMAVQRVLDRRGSTMKIIAKIENQSGVDNIDGILDVAYGVMVARGDLAIEIPYAKVPGVQKMLVGKCMERRKPVIIATQMLHSMINNPRPTRAEVSDVASAIYGQTDAIMLSGETAVGRYPVEAVKAMTKIAVEVEKSREPMNDLPVVVLNNRVSAFLIHAAVKGAVDLDASAIVADTTSGRTIRSLAAYRGNRVIHAMCYREDIMRQLSLSYGVYPRHMRPGSITHQFIGEALSQLKSGSLLDDEDIVVVVAGNFGRSRGVSFVEIGSVGDLVEASGMA